MSLLATTTALDPQRMARGVEVAGGESDAGVEVQEPVHGRLGREPGSKDIAVTGSLVRLRITFELRCIFPSIFQF